MQSTRAPYPNQRQRHDLKYSEAYKIYYFWTKKGTGRFTAGHGNAKSKLRGEETGMGFEIARRRCD